MLVTVSSVRKPDTAVFSPVPGWAPSAPQHVASSRRSSTLGASWDAIRGVAERGDGQPLTDAQVATIAPFLATAFGLPAQIVHDDLRGVRIYTGGAAAGNGGWAVTIGRDIYVADGRGVDRITSWEGRRWLVHELGHTMQWRATDKDSDRARNRAFLWSYVAENVVDPGVRPGAVPRGLWQWVKSRVGKPDPEQPEPRSIKSAIHDAHRMERQAEQVARAFVDATS